MGKYEKKSRPHGGKYQRRGEKGKGNKILPGLLAAAAVLMAVILIFDQPEQTAPETTPVQIQTEAPTAAEATQPVAENPETESDTQPMTQTRQEEPEETQAAWFAHLFDRISGEENPQTDNAEQEGTEPSTQATQPAPMGTKFQRMTYMEMASGDLVLVNEQYAFPSSMVSVTTLHDKALPLYHVEDVTLSVQSHVVEPLNSWLGAFVGETGNREVLVNKGYQTEDPDMPEYHTGLAVELDTYHIATSMDDDEIYEQLADSAWEYGFVRRWAEEKAELTGVTGRNWQFRYVGIPHSVVMAEEELCLEEYLEYIREYTFEEGPLEIEYQDQEYEIYFCEGLEVTVPVNRKYTVSGNNVDGFIVTVTVSG